MSVLQVAKPVTYTTRIGGQPCFQPCGNKSAGSEGWTFLRPRFLFISSTAFKNKQTTMVLFKPVLVGWYNQKNINKYQLWYQKWSYKQTVFERQ